MELELLNRHIANKDFPEEIFGVDPNKDYVRFDKKEICHSHKNYDQKEGLTDSRKSIISDFKESVSNELKDAQIISVESHLVDDYYEGLHDEDMINDFISVETTINIEHAGKQFSLYYEGANQYDETFPVGCSLNLIEHLKETQNFKGNEDYDYESAAIDVVTGLFAKEAQEHHAKEFGAGKIIGIPKETLAQQNAEYMSSIADAVSGVKSANATDKYVADAQFDQVRASVFGKSEDKEDIKNDQEAGKDTDDFFAKVKAGTLGKEEAEEKAATQEQTINPQTAKQAVDHKMAQ